ncbi:MAG: hypothetical protein JWM16_6334 [Verrucomicrobiales bacterium]|nr:hypothetical protein [Verrucomicrobiales bacterium]
MSRKRKTGKREPNGKLSRRVVDKQARRSIDEQSAMQVAKEARQRQFGVPAEASGTDRAGTVVGRLAMKGTLTTAQLEAAKAFATSYSKYQRALNSPRPPKAVEIGGATGRGDASDISPEQHVKALREWDAAKMCLSEANGFHRHATLYVACDYLVIRDELQEHLVGDLKLALNALVHFYGLNAIAA